eukprot:6466999-Amphidinium_carterae.1
MKDHLFRRRSADDGASYPASWTREEVGVLRRFYVDASSLSNTYHDLTDMHYPYTRTKTAQ